MNNTKQFNNDKLSQTKNKLINKKKISQIKDKLINKETSINKLEHNNELQHLNKLEHNNELKHLNKMLYSDDNYYYYLYYKFNYKTGLYIPYDHQHDWIVMLEYIKSDSKCNLYNNIYQQACFTNTINLFDPFTILTNNFEDEIMKLLDIKQKYIINYITKKYTLSCLLQVKELIINMWFNNSISLFNEKIINFKICNTYYLK